VGCPLRLDEIALALTIGTPVSIVLAALVARRGRPVMFTVVSALTILYGLVLAVEPGLDEWLFEAG